MKTEASRLLAEATTPRKSMSQADLARELGVSRQTVSGWVAGLWQPTTELMGRIEDLLGIPMRAWTRKQEAEDTDSESAGLTGTEHG